jgi:hypothetical protein
MNAPPRRLVIMALFAFVGPAIGYALLPLPWGWKGVEALPGWLLVAALIPRLFLVPAYVIGMPPAVLAGLTAVLALRSRSGWMYLLLSILAGALASPVWTWVFFFAVNQTNSAAPMYVTVALIGGLSAAICSLLTLRVAQLELPRPVWLNPLWRLRAGDVLLAVVICLSIWMAVELLLPALVPS